MSVRWLSSCWETETGSTHLKVVLMVLADHADEDGYCWPRVKTIASKTEMHESTVRAKLGELEDQGLIEVREDYEPAGRQTSNVYRLLVNQQSPPISPRGGRVVLPEGEGRPPRGSTRTVNKPSRNEPATGGSLTRSRRTVTSDDETSPAEESPAMGRAPRKSTSERNEIAEQRGVSAFGQVRRLKRGLLEQGFVVPVNEKILTKNLNVMLKQGLPMDTLRGMVDIFVANPKRYLQGDQVAWVGFLAAREKLAADAAKKVRAKAPDAAVFKNIYAEFDKEQQ